MGLELLEDIRSGVGTRLDDGYAAVAGENAPGVPTWFVMYNRSRSKEDE